MRFVLSLALSLFTQLARAESVTVVNRGDCWQNTYTFDSGSISKERFEELLSLARENKGKWMNHNWVEACAIPSCTLDVHKVAFFDNAEENQRALKARIESLDALKAPPELAPIVDFYKEQNAFTFWVNSLRLRLYKTWQANSLEARYYIKPAKKSIDASTLCRDLIDGLTREKDHDKIYATTQGGLNCVNTEFQHSVSYSTSAWSAFLKSYHINENHTESSCD